MWLDTLINGLSIFILSIFKILANLWISETILNSFFGAFDFI